MALVSVHRQHDDTHLWMILDQPTRRFEAVEARHRDIHQYDVGAQLGDVRERLATVAGLADDLDARKLADQRFEAGANQKMVVAQQETDGSHGTANLTRAERRAVGDDRRPEAASPLFPR